MIWEFYKYENKHGKASTAYDIQMNGASRSFIFYNDPKHQRVCHCQKCRTKIPREVPRIKFDASYYYSSGYYCLSCGSRLLEEKHSQLQKVVDILQGEIKKLDEMMDISEEVMQDEFYSKKMALARMIQVIKGE